MLFSFCCCSNNKKDTKKSEKDENFIVVFVRKGPKRGRQRVGGWQHKKRQTITAHFLVLLSKIYFGLQWSQHSQKNKNKNKIFCFIFLVEKGKRTKSLRKLMLNGKGIPPKKNQANSNKKQFFSLSCRVVFYMAN